VTFREQAKKFLLQKTMSKRRPIKQATLRSWQNCVDKWLNPNLGDIPLSGINNATVKKLIAKMHNDGLSPKSILNYTGLVKAVVGSAKSDEGEQLFRESGIQSLWICPSSRSSGNRHSHQTR